MTERKEAAQMKTSNLERVFGFENRNFKNYILLKSGSKTTPETFLQLSLAMLNDSNHPLVTYAAGWAAAEAALHRSRPSAAKETEYFTVEKRLKAVEFAGLVWNQARMELGKAREKTNLSSKYDAEFWTFELRARQNLASLPAMNLAATLFSNSEVTPEDKTHTLQQTKENMIDLSSTIMTLDQDKKSVKNMRSGLLTEMLASLLIQNDPSMKWITIPSSIRQDNHDNAGFRTDLIAISLEPTYPKTAIQVTSDASINKKSKLRFVVNSWEELTLDEDGSPRDTLQALISKEKKTSRNPVLDKRLEALSQSLVDRLDRFRSK